MKHIRGFDVLRSFAVLGVMIYHLGVTQFSYGWLGVPFFFVLSGFLITGILIDNKDSSGGNYFSTFFYRRCLRIFPVYYLCIAVVAAWCIWFGASYEGWSYFLLYVQNYYLGANNLGMPPGMSLGHTWSLAVEEQFYLLWPFIVYFTTKRQLQVLCLILIAASVISRYWIVVNTTFVPFTPLTSNFDTLCLGALLAIVYRESVRRLRTMSFALLAAGVALALVAPNLAWGTMNSADSIFMLSMALVFSGVVGLVSSGTLPIPDSRALSYIGRISYGLYIWHAFAYMVIDTSIYNKYIEDYGTLSMNIIRVALTFAIAIPSYHLFELPIMRLKGRFTYRSAGTQQLAS